MFLIMLGTTNWWITFAQVRIYIICKFNRHITIGIHWHTVQLTLLLELLEFLDNWYSHRIKFNSKTSLQSGKPDDLSAMSYVHGIFN